MQEWISVKDMQPERSGKYLVVKRYDNECVVGILLYSAKHKLFNAVDWHDAETARELSCGYVTHWMPFPVLPKEET